MSHHVLPETYWRGQRSEVDKVRRHDVTEVADDGGEGAWTLQWREEEVWAGHETRSDLHFQDANT